ncbi:MAG: glutamine-hydrolyzing carbamoyl-phosphate synthase small subunit [Fibrobacterota bacterium]
MKAILLLKDGTRFEGRSFGASGQKCGEVVFNTSLCGYQEVLTDPSYCEQIVTMTYPLQGNYGINPQDVESGKVQVAGFVVKENCPYPSNYRSTETLSDYLAKAGVMGIEGIDTRMLVRHIREKGAMTGILSTDGTDINTLKEKLDTYPGMAGRDLASVVTSKKSYTWNKSLYDPVAAKQEKAPKAKYRVVALDFGIKQNILRLLVSHGFDVTVMPAQTSAKDVLAKKPHGIFLSNGPGDPEAVTYAISTVKELLGKRPIFGICLGHQILTWALGGKTYKLKFGHRGANHPVKNLKTNAIEITSQNHGFCSDMNSLKGKGVDVTHLNLNDKTVEGIRCKKLKAFAVQYHPEASPGPHDSNYLFDDFVKMI